MLGKKKVVLLLSILLSFPVFFYFFFYTNPPPESGSICCRVQNSHVDLSLVKRTTPSVKREWRGWVIVRERILPFKGKDVHAAQDTPPTSPGWDFWVFWRTGRAADPYEVQGAIYPPPMTLLFRVIGLLPESYAFYLWTAFNLVLFVFLFKRRAILYIFFMPTLFQFATGQLDILFMWFSTFLKRDDWFAGVLGALITFKPQVAIILLPWHLLRWQKKSQLIWAFLTAALWGGYWVVRPQMYQQWLNAAFGTYGVEGTATPSVFSVFPFVLAAVVSVLILIFAWRYLNEKAAIAAGVLTMPFGKTYDAVFLLRSGVTWWIVLLSWVSLGLSHYVGAPWPQALVTAVVFVRASRKSLKENPVQFPSLVNRLGR